MSPQPRQCGEGSSILQAGTLRRAVYLSIPRVSTVEQLDQRYLLVPEKVKDAYLVHLIQRFQDEHEDWSIIIFTNTCK